MGNFSRKKTFANFKVLGYMQKFCPQDLWVWHLLAALGQLVIVFSEKKNFSRNLQVWCPT